jgi:hypothetical protein
MNVNSKERLAAHVHDQEVGDDEAIAFLHNQLLAQRDRRIEAPAFRHGILIGVAASGIVLAVSIGLFLILNPIAEQTRAAPESTGGRRTVSEESSTLRPADLHSSDAEIAALLRRGDAFLTSGDITSARLFYERAAEAGSGPAALLLGATFDPVMYGHVGALDAIADPAQALTWYRRARDLGMVEAEQQIKRFETPSLDAGSQTKKTPARQ